MMLMKIFITISESVTAIASQKLVSRILLLLPYKSFRNNRDIFL